MFWVGKRSIAMPLTRERLLARGKLLIAKLCNRRAPLDPFAIFHFALRWLAANNGTSGAAHAPADATTGLALLQPLMPQPKILSATGNDES
jgi:hypothetical protein